MAAPRKEPLLDEASQLHALYGQADALRDTLATRLVAVRDGLLPLEAQIVNLDAESRILSTDMLDQFEQAERALADMRRAFEESHKALRQRLNDVQARLALGQAQLAALFPEEG